MILWRGRENESELSVQNCPCFWPVLNIQDVIMLSTIPNTQLHYFKAFLCRDSVFPPPNRKAACLNIKTKRIIKNKDILKRSSPCILYSTLDEAGALSETSSVSATSKRIFAYIISHVTHTHTLLQNILTRAAVAGRVSCTGTNSSAPENSEPD